MTRDYGYGPTLEMPICAYVICDALPSLCLSITVLKLHFKAAHT